MITKSNPESPGEEIEIRVHFQGHYSEPYFHYEIPKDSIFELESKQQLICDIEYDIQRLDWIS